MGTESQQWTETKQKVFEALKITSAFTPALQLPDVSKYFFLLFHKTKGKKDFNLNFEAIEIPCDIHVQMIRPCSRRMDHLFKSCDEYC